MPRFVPSASIVEAIQFSGTSESALAAASAIGKALSFSIDGESVRLVAAKKRIPPGAWIVRVGKRLHIISAEAFAADYVAMDEVKASPAVAPRPPRVPGIFGEGDFILDATNTDLGELEILEVNGSSLLCDGAFGQTTVMASNASFVRKAGE